MACTLKNDTCIRSSEWSGDTKVYSEVKKSKNEEFCKNRLELTMLCWMCPLIAHGHQQSIVIDISSLEGESYNRLKVVDLTLS